MSETYIDTIIDENGNEMHPVTETKAVHLPEGRRLQDAMVCKGDRPLDPSVPVSPIDADMLGGHEVEYFATAEMMNNMSFIYNDAVYIQSKPDNDHFIQEFIDKNGAIGIYAKNGDKTAAINLSALNNTVTNFPTSGVANGARVLKDPKKVSDYGYVKPLPHYYYTEIDPTHGTTTYLQNLLKQLVKDGRTDLNYCALIGGITPNSHGICLLFAYEFTNYNNTGYPRYSTGLYLPLLNNGSQQTIRFGTWDGVYLEKIL